MIVNEIKKHQQDWAKNKIGTKGLYCVNVYDNIFSNKLLEKVEARFKKANGNELIDSDKAKMRALHSSSAFCVNVFQYLLEKQMLDIVSDVFGVRMNNPLNGDFEYKFPIKGTKTGNRFPANLDFVIEGANELIAIESKFTEPYGKVSGDSRLLKQSYLDPNSNYEFIIKRFSKLKEWIDTWETEKYDENKIARVCPYTYKYLDAAQLIKHLLGLSSQNKKYKLCYLYYCVASDEMKKHSEELEDFQKHLDDCINFKAMSYQEFFSKLKLKMQEHGKYLDYMKDRYNL
ncbi:MAG: hypothetical protein J5542_00920 [Bacteroidales bacterium]|nr:hypothetical protein [Bacteroidales bacterium]